MADIIYRETDAIPTRTSSSVKAAPLTNAELDGNLKLIDEELAALKGGDLDDRSLTPDKLIVSGVTAGVYGTSTKVAKVTVNDSGLVQDIEEEDILMPVKQSVVATYTNNENFTTVTPFDDTIPQITEGSQVFSVDITPISSTSKLIIEFDGMVAVTTPGIVTFALHQGTDADAVAARSHFLSSTDPQSLSMRFVVTPNVLTSLTFSLRVGPSGVNTVRLNGTSTARRLGGASAATFRITEII